MLKVAIVFILLSIPLVIFADLGSGNIVGYIQTNYRKGHHVNTLEPVGGGPSKLSEIISINCEGGELKFYDGYQWRHVISADGMDGKLHWYDLKTQECADDYEIPTGINIAYEIPEGIDGAFSFSGQVPAEFLENDIGPLFTDGPALNKLKLTPEEVAKIMGLSTKIVREKTVITNDLPSHFILRLKDGSIIHAKYDYLKMSILDAETEREVSTSADLLESFNIETNQSIATNLRMNENQLMLLRKAYLKEYQGQKDKKEQENAAKGIEDALFSSRAVKKWIFGAIGAIIVTILGNNLPHWIVLFWAYLRRKISLYSTRLKGRRLYKKTINKKNSVN